MEEQIRILLVDDEIDVLRSLERTFLDEEYEILTAPSGKRGASRNAGKRYRSAGSGLFYAQSGSDDHNPAL